MDPAFDYSDLGGKAKNLARLSLQQFPVPDWAAISASTFREALTLNAGQYDLAAQLTELPLTGPDELPSLCESIQSSIVKLPLPDQLEHWLNSWIQKYTNENSLLAVRSSALDEDHADASFAGMHDSYLGIHPQDLATYIRKVWASAFNLRAIEYRREQGLSLSDISMSVIIQQMVQPQASGVMFTINPINQNPQEVLISSVFGLGEGLVSGALAADHHVMSKQGEGLKEELVSKDARLVMTGSPENPVKVESIAPEAQNQAALNGVALQDVLSLGLLVEQYYREAQDIEFAVDASGKVYLLQSRPITTVAYVGPAAGFHQIWDNSNIIESYSGVTRPLTFSFIRHAYRNVYESFCEVMKVPPAEIEKSQSTYDNMLGYLNGHVYYNLMNWYRLIQLFPGYELNKRFMESMMGVGEKLNPEDKNQNNSTLSQRLFKEWPRFFALLLAMSWRFWKIQKLVDQFDAYFYSLYNHWRDLDYNSMAAHELMSIYREMEIKLLRKWRSPIINDFYVMIFYGVLKSLCKKWVGDEDGTLQNDLIVGEGDIESTMPTQLLMKLATRIKNDADMSDVFLQHTPEELHLIIQQNDCFAPIRPDIAHYLEAYGDRCMSELKLESVTLRDDPAFMYRMLQNYVRMDQLPEMDDHHTAKIRKDAEQHAMSQLSGFKAALFTRVLNAARRGVKNRENMRLARTRIYGLIRRIFRAVGLQWEQSGILAHREDIFYLTVDEVWDFVSGTAVTTDLQGIVTIRKAEQERFEMAPEPADRFSTWGSPYHRNSFSSFSSSNDIVSDDPNTLQGTGCSPGEVEGITKVILSPEADMKLNGEILVAGRTDPGWVVLYPSISGLLIERGSILSHSAIVAREMGIPTIVGIKGLTQRVQSGEIVRMNGASGEVKLHVDSGQAENPTPEASTE